MNAFDNINDDVLAEEVVIDEILTSDGWSDFGDDEEVVYETSGASLMKLQDSMDCEAYVKDPAGLIPAGTPMRDYIREIGRAHV